MDKPELDILHAMCPLIDKLIILAREKCSVSSHGPDSWSLRTIQEIDHEREQVMAQLEVLKASLIEFWCS